jgi:predicted nucleic acid-binding protein
MIVVDASAAVKWLVPEHGSDEAERLLNGSERLVAPGLIRVEVHAALTRRFRMGEAPEAEVLQNCREWAALIDEGIITLMPERQDESQAIALALQLKHPYQDCLYLALAERLQVPLVTADPKFIERTTGIYPAVRPLLAAAPKSKRH